MRRAVLAVVGGLFVATAAFCAGAALELRRMQARLDEALRQRDAETARAAEDERTRRVDTLRAQAGLRAALFDELQPQRLANCDLARFGEPRDGGYLVCRNLLDDVRAAYSYGIGGYDGWGCDISTARSIPVHQYDCFDLRQPACPTGDPRFHPECVSSAKFRDTDGRSFDIISSQVRANGDAARRLVVKIDVEGAEWEAFAQVEDAVLAQIDQLVVEFHGVDESRFLSVIRRLKARFVLAHLHFNNGTCDPDLDPLPASVFEVLLVSKRLAVVDSSAGPVPRPHPLDAPNADGPDCQG